MNDSTMSISLSMSDFYPLISEAISRGQSVRLKVRGNSMYPFLKDGRDTVVFSPFGGRKIRRGDIILFERSGGQLVMHRVYAVGRDGALTMVGDNQIDLETEVLPGQLVAYVAEIERKGKNINCEKGTVRRLMTLYMRLRVRHPAAMGRLVRALYRLRTSMARK